jgi:hypothetical protein
MLDILKRYFFLEIKERNFVKLLEVQCKIKEKIEVNYINPGQKQ